MKCLFCIKDQGGHIHANAFFENKAECKVVRNGLNKKERETGGKNSYHVSRGPDHMGPHGSNRKGWKQKGGK